MTGRGKRKEGKEVREATSWAEQLWLTKAKVLLPFNSRGKKKKNIQSLVSLKLQPWRY